MHGPTCIFWANLLLTPFSLKGASMAVKAGNDMECSDDFPGDPKTGVFGDFQRCEPRSQPPS